MSLDSRIIKPMVEKNSGKKSESDLDLGEKLRLALARNADTNYEKNNNVSLLSDAKRYYLELRNELKYHTNVKNNLPVNKLRKPLRSLEESINEMHELRIIVKEKFVGQIEKWDKGQ
jgi:CRISPR/Cas system CMR subunit Cmr4 (Cas7 group RAMP superfamily)